MDNVIAYDKRSAELFHGYIAYKRALGYRMDKPSQYTLRRVLYAIDSSGADPDVVGREVADELTALRAGESSRSRHNRVCMLRQLCLWLEKMGFRPCTPPADMARTASGFVPRIVSDKEMATILEVADGPKAHAWEGLLLRILWCCGMRLGEATSLSVGDVDLDEGTLLVRHAKGDRTRLLPMSQSLREYVATYMRAVVAEGAAPGMPLMPTRNGRIRAGSNCWLALNAIFAEAGVLTSRGRPIRIHDLRHSYAVHALEKMAASGMDLYVALPLLSAYMGHADVKSTEYYLRLTEVAMADLIDVQAPTSDVIFGGVS